MIAITWHIFKRQIIAGAISVLALAFCAWVFSQCVGSP